MMVKKISNVEKKIRKYYEDIWSPPILIKNRIDNPLLGFHYGFYEKGIKNFKDAAINMNDFVGRLLNLDNKKGRIIDLGCGIGSTIIYLAMKYPNIKFFGITLAPSEINFAKKLQKEKQVENAEFILGNFIKTNFSDEYFDGAFALESFCYAQNKRDFLNEIKRILKSGEKLLIIDGFLKDISLASFMQIVYKSLLSRRAVPNLMNINDLKLYLEEGFKEVNILELSHKTAFLYNFLQQDYLKIIIKFFYVQLNRLLKGKSFEPKKDIDYIWGALVPELFLGLNKKIGYYVVTAIKK